MSPVLGVLLKVILASPKLVPQIIAEVKAAKARMPTDAEIQALPDDEAAIAAFKLDVDAGLAENAAIQARLAARAAALGAAPTGD
jgi:hypothetical protein